MLLVFRAEHKSVSCEYSKSGTATLWRRLQGGLHVDQLSRSTVCGTMTGQVRDLWNEVVFLM